MLQALKSSFGWKLGAKRFDPDRIVLCARRKDPIAVPLIFEFATWPVFFANLNQVRLFFHKPVSEMKHIFWRGVEIILVAPSLETQQLNRPSTDHKQSVPQLDSMVPWLRGSFFLATTTHLFKEVRYQRLGWFFRSMDLDERCLVAADVT